MKLASLKSMHSRDGELCLVDRSLSKVIRVSHIAATLQVALEHWDAVFPQLQALYLKLNAGL